VLFLGVMNIIIIWIQLIEIQLNFLSTSIIIKIACINHKRYMGRLLKLILLTKLGNLRNLVNLAMLKSILISLIVLSIRTSI
jgi:hypothetical protein